ncbi:hypothetical protein PAXINDRAFT_16356 [Paxillus involutus ATCC 200175]|uniref:Unplaced genomic scaffold PAXINscaffold_77, whole genome shotgun sequence n=1 Tax=Paxillus involutus ATCC 200175 TaxID=664439 RepID=A0A0C9SRV0_PAXIN|nr:hypothetical protein PAXINDRAFT_16356 [Paxillus involutus ATCC 200175]
MPCVDARRLAWSWGWGRILWMRRVWTWWPHRLPSVVSSSSAHWRLISPSSSLPPILLHLLTFLLPPYLFVSPYTRAAHRYCWGGHACGAHLAVDAWCRRTVFGMLVSRGHGGHVVFPPSFVIYCSLAIRLSLVFPSPSFCSTSLPFHSLLTSSSHCTLVLRVDIAGVAVLTVHAQLSTPGVEVTGEVAWGAGESLGRQWVIWPCGPWLRCLVVHGPLGLQMGRLGVVFGISGVLVGYFSSGE